MEVLLRELGLSGVQSGAYADRWLETGGEELASIDPSTGKELGRVRLATLDDYETVVEKSRAAFERWRMVPAPARGDVVREIGLELRRLKKPLGALVSAEMGKIRAEGEGEVQEMIDIADFAVGLSRQLYGLTIASERPRHRMFEQWHPIGVVGIISAFNFPVAVWAWNAMIAAVCGDSMIWKPSPATPLCAVAVTRIAGTVLARHGHGAVMSLCLGETETVGEAMIADRRLPVISATGSCRMGRHVGQVVAARLGRTILELGGNNAIVVDESADLDLACRAVLFGAVGTAGQRCTSTRRLFVHESKADDLIGRLVAAYGQVKIGPPLDEGILMGPLIDDQAVRAMMAALEEVRRHGGKILHGGNRLEGRFVEPTLVEVDPSFPLLAEETFAPLLYVVRVRDLDEAIRLQNDVPQGLSSAIFTDSLRRAEEFLSPRGSDCGIANVNIGTSGAEIGGAFGGEKDTGGGREAGSDSWKGYMRRQTCTVNWGGDLPLAQGIEFA
jgi:aldehyde dehydrogenase (NAD+)